MAHPSELKSELESFFSAFPSGYSNEQMAEQLIRHFENSEQFKIVDTSEPPATIMDVDCKELPKKLVQEMVSEADYMDTCLSEHLYSYDSIETLSTEAAEPNRTYFVGILSLMRQRGAAYMRIVAW